MLSEIVFAVASIVAFGAALFMFKAREMAHAMLGFLLITIAAAGLLVVLDLPLLALLQLFIMVGGVSTYLFVGVSSENLSRFRHTSLPVLVVLAIALAAVPIYRISMLQNLGGQSNALNASVISAAVSSNITLFYMLAILLFGIGVGSIIMMKSLKAGGKR
jgi:NADH:ubiquinone oxidoreductase subunit 6 (subunit J)